MREKGEPLAVSRSRYLIQGRSPGGGQGASDAVARGEGLPELAWRGAEAGAVGTRLPSFADAMRGALSDGTFGHLSPAHHFSSSLHATVAQLLHAPH